jgi:hypothetical protein
MGLCVRSVRSRHKNSESIAVPSNIPTTNQRLFFECHYDFLSPVKLYTLEELCGFKARDQNHLFN